MNVHFENCEEQSISTAKEISCLSSGCGIQSTDLDYTKEKRNRSPPPSLNFNEDTDDDMSKSKGEKADPESLDPDGSSWILVDSPGSAFSPLSESIDYQEPNNNLQAQAHETTQLQIDSPQNDVAENGDNEQNEQDQAHASGLLESLQ